MLKVKRTLMVVLTLVLLAGFCQPVMADSGKVNINTALKDQLMTLKGVGDKVADRIIEHRKDNPFKTIEDLMNVKGIGQKTFDKMKAQITVKDE